MYMYDNNHVMLLLSLLTNNVVIAFGYMYLYVQPLLRAAATKPSNPMQVRPYLT